MTVLTRKRISHGLLSPLAASVTLLTGACTTLETQSKADAALQRLAERVVGLQIDSSPPSAYFLGVPAPDHRRWEDRSQQGILAAQRQRDDILADIRRLDPARLTTPQSRSQHAAMLEWLEAEKQMRICRLDLWSVSHVTGWHLGLSLVSQEQPLGTVEQRADALARWSALPELIDQEIANARLGLSKGYSAPQAVVQRVIRQIDRLATSPLEKLPFVALVQRTEDSAFQESIREVLDGPVRTAFGRYREFLQREYLPRARETLGVSANPNGVACYRASLRSYTTLTRTPEEVFQLGQRTVTANADRVRELGRAQFGTDDLGKIVPQIPKAADNRFATEQEFIDFSRDAVARSRDLSKSMFLSMPAQEMRVEPIEAFQRGSGASSHYQPQVDPALPAFYRIKSEAWQNETRGGAEITAVHEGYPGHHMQMSLVNMLGPNPVTELTSNSAYGEGWARYSEALAEEAGIYRTPYALMTRRLWPARGLVVDPGLHVMGWSRQQVIDFIRQSGRFGGTDADDLVDRIASSPGQLTAYDSGGLEIMALRREAETALGARFDIREFHQRVLENGSIPLTALRQKITAWVAAERRGM